MFHRFTFVMTFLALSISILASAGVVEGEFQPVEKTKITADNWWYEGCDFHMIVENKLETAMEGLDGNIPADKLISIALAQVNHSIGDSSKKIILVASETDSKSEAKDRELSWRIGRLLKAGGIPYTGQIGEYRDSRLAVYSATKDVPSTSQILMLKNPNFPQLFMNQLLGDETANGHIEALRLEVLYRQAHEGRKNPTVVYLELNSFDSKGGLYSKGGLFGPRIVTWQGHAIWTENHFLEELMKLSDKWEKEGIKVQFLVRGRLFVERHKGYWQFSPVDTGIQRELGPETLRMVELQKPRYVEFKSGIVGVLVPNASSIEK